MKITKVYHYCDICQKDYAKDAVMYKGKRKSLRWLKSKWERIEICESCMHELEKMIINRGDNQ